MNNRHRIGTLLGREQKKNPDTGHFSDRLDNLNWMKSDQKNPFQGVKREN